MHLCIMATKTISIDEEAYERLTRAKLDRRESFSKVIKRATWRITEPNCGNLLRTLENMSPIDEAEIERLESAQQEDLPPENSWSH